MTWTSQVKPTGFFSPFMSNPSCPTISLATSTLSYITIPVAAVPLSASSHPYPYFVKKRESWSHFPHLSVFHYRHRICSQLGLWWLLSRGELGKVALLLFWWNSSQNDFFLMKISESYKCLLVKNLKNDPCCWTFFSENSPLYMSQIYSYLVP